MKEINIIANIQVCCYTELDEAEKKLVEEAKNATVRSYSPYSKFKVGAAVLTEDGTMMSGTNQENAASPSGMCAERTTIYYVNAMYPDKKVTVLAIAAYTEGDFTNDPVTPCGACRQVILETEKRYGNEIKILMYGKSKIYKVKGIKSLLPLSFDGSEMVI